MPIASTIAFTLLAPQAPASPPFMISVQAWTFNNFSVTESIEKVALAGGKIIELFPGQKTSPSVNAGVGPNMGEDAEKILRDSLAKNGVQVKAFGVTSIPKDETESRKLFRWAKSFGIEIINTESADSIGTIDKMVKEFDMRVGFHNHPKRNDNPNYKMWDPVYVYNLVKNYDKRIGSCADTGHWVRSGIKPVDAIKALKGRIVSSHLKDLNVFAPQGHDMPYGNGVSDIMGILREYRKIGLKGTVSIEYEHNWGANVPDVAHCIGFLRGAFARL